MKIKQLIPALGWYVRFLKPDGGVGYQELVFWAIYEDPENDDFVTGLIAAPGGKLSPCSSLEDIEGYSFQPQLEEE
jgi:hypothetical protein